MPKITILLSTYNGEKYLKEQLNSLFSQTYKNFEIIVRDDGSSDKTLEVLKYYDVKLLSSDGNIGIKKSFETLLKYAYENSDADYFMFCDQDDVWNDNKIEKTLEEMKRLEKLYGNNTPLLVHTDLEVVDENLKTISSSMWKYEYILPQFNTFNRLLIQNTITGCTMMINRELAKKSLDIPEESIMHDWWIGLIASCFGKISYLEESTIKYRQHGKNTIGTEGKKNKIIRKALGLLNKKNEYINHMDINILQAKGFLKLFNDKLDGNKVNLLELFSTIKKKTFFERKKILIKHKLFKQGIFRNIGLIIII